MKKLIIFISITSIFIFLTLSGLYAFSQYLKKGTVNAVLQYQVNLDNPPENIYAISTVDQTTQSGKTLPKGTIFIGTLNKEEGIPVIYFNSIQPAGRKTENFIAKSGLKVIQSGQSTGVSAKLGKTIHQQTKTNVIGAIFHNSSSNSRETVSSVLPKGYAIKIEK